jgi:hypothetical protein
VGVLIPAGKLIAKYYYDCITDSDDHARTSKLFIVLDALLPNFYKKLSSTPVPNKTIYNKHSLVVQLNNALMIMLAFGLFFPPLAIIIFLAIGFSTFFDEIMLGKLLLDAKSLGFIWYQAQVELECDNVADVFHTSIWIALCLSSFMGGYIVFDTLGDTFGWRKSIGPAIAVCVAPLVINMYYYVEALSTNVADAIRMKKNIQNRESSFFELLPTKVSQLQPEQSISGKEIATDQEKIKDKAVEESQVHRLELSNFTDNSTDIVVKNPLAQRSDHINNKL